MDRTNGDAAAPDIRGLVLPTHDNATADAVVSYVATTCQPAIVHHCARVYCYARELAFEEEEAPPDVELFCACLLHDLGTASAVGPERFEVQGADLAAGFLTAHGWSTAATRRVWTAVALHTSPHIAERISPLARLVRMGVRTDFGADLVTPPARHIAEDRFPRHDIERVLSRAIVDLASDDDRRAPAATWPGGLLRAHRSNDGDAARLQGF